MVIYLVWGRFVNPLIASLIPPAHIASPQSCRGVCDNAVRLVGCHFWEAVGGGSEASRMLVGLS
eukprot:5520272-Pyramimonas_sp.AAC.1